MNYIGLGKRIRTQRRKLHWTQEELAERVGISLSFIGHIERGTRKASLDTLVSISNILKVSPALLLRDSLIDDYTSPSGGSSARQLELINEISKVILETYDA